MDLLHKGVYGFAMGVVADRLARPVPVWVQARRERSDPKLEAKTHGLHGRSYQRTALCGASLGLASNPPDTMPRDTLHSTALPWAVTDVEL